MNKMQREDGSMLALPEDGAGPMIITGQPKRTPLFYESMTEVRDPNPESRARVRIWRRCEKLPDEIDMELMLLFNKIPGGCTFNEMADIISSIERVTAFEITDANGCGAVCYMEW